MKRRRRACLPSLGAAALWVSGCGEVGSSGWRPDPAPALDGGAAERDDAGRPAAGPVDGGSPRAVDAAGLDAARPPEDAGGACPWGAQVPEDDAVGLASVPHANGPTADERAVFDAMNAQRSGPPLVWSACLADLARSHSTDMVTAKYYGHGSASDPSAFLIADRVRAAGLTLAGAANEDVLTGDLRYWLGSDVRNVVAKWMSDDHALPILGCAQAGVGVASMPYQDTTIVWVTADFDCP